MGIINVDPGAADGLQAEPRVLVGVEKAGCHKQLVTLVTDKAKCALVLRGVAVLGIGANGVLKSNLLGMSKTGQVGH